MNCFLVPPRLSKAPALMKFSTARLFTSLSEVRSRNSFRFWNGPLALRSATMSSMADWPTPLMAVRA